ncbi:hypothetical protein [Salininema proteolyticum]|uniref:Uncharacterized protein n=1 Tax=Salininema proteolyticum TaxID=1607685 RepID=A0ABV8U411_9ACTN
MGKSGGADIGRASTATATTLSVTGAGVLFLLLRLFAVVDYNWDSAFAIAETMGVDDIPSIMFGSLLGERFYHGFFLAVLLPFTVGRQIRLGRPLREHTANLALLVIAAVLMFSYVATYRDWWMLGVTAVLMALELVWIRRRKGWGEEFATYVSVHFWKIVLVAVFLSAALLRTPWVPLERIELADGETVEGYVMDTPSGFLKVLEEEGREIRILISGDVESREEV